MPKIDSTVQVVTPENIAFDYTVAGPFRRFPAFLLDFLLRMAIWVAVLIAVAISSAAVGATGLAAAGLLVFYFLLDWFYGGMFETWMNGQTPGKWMMGIRVVTVDGQPINGLQAVMRNLLRSLDMFPLLSIEALGAPVPYFAIPTFMLALIVMSLNRHYQRIGDIVCRTMVVVEERSWLTGVVRLEDPRIPQLASHLPADFAISRSLAKTLAGYVERRRFFSLPRRHEVARHVAQPLLERFGFPADTSYDLLLCALYYRAFIADRGSEEAGLPEGASPFRQEPAAPPPASKNQGASVS